MKKCFTLVVVIIGIMAFTSMAFCEYKETIKSDIQNALSAFFQMEQGNKITQYNMRGLIMELDQVFIKNKVVPEAVKPQPAPPADKK